MRRLLPPLGKELRRWSGQVLEPVDGVAFIGRDPGSERVFVATGNSGQGMTHGALAGLIIKDLILTGANRWAETYDPARKPISADRRIFERKSHRAEKFRRICHARRNRLMGSA